MKGEITNYVKETVEQTGKIDKRQELVEQALYLHLILDLGLPIADL